MSGTVLIWIFLVLPFFSFSVILLLLYIYLASFVTSFFKISLFSCVILCSCFSSLYFPSIFFACFCYFCFSLRHLVLTTCFTFPNSYCFSPPPILCRSFSDVYLFSNGKSWTTCGLLFFRLIYNEPIYCALYIGFLMGMHLPHRQRNLFNSSFFLRISFSTLLLIPNIQFL